MPSTDNKLNVGSDVGFDLWHRMTCQNFSLSECRPTSTEEFSAQIAGRPFGSLRLSAASSRGIGSIRLTRGRAQISKDPRDYFMLYLVLDGQVDIEQSGRQASALAGDMFLYDQTVPFSLDIRGNNRSILVNIPRQLLLARLSGATQCTGQRIAGGSQLGALARSVVQQIVEIDLSARSSAEERLVDSTMDVVATALDVELGDEVQLRSEQHRLLQKVQRYMLAHVHEAAITIEAIAQAQNVAPRTLHRIFATEGTTPMRWLLRQRLATSHKLLAEGLVDSVTEAAFRLGFSDVSHFGRAFKREFGRLPQSVRRPKIHE
jgi:AraC-like DNA-binding protein